jgi:hypothetical protein
MNHRDEAIALGAKLTKLPASAPIFAAVFDEAKKGKYVSPTGEIPLDRLKWLAGVLLNAKKLSHAVDFAAYTDPQLHAEAVKLSGR